MYIKKETLQSFVTKNPNLKFDIVLLSNSLHHIFKQPVNTSELNSFFDIIFSLINDDGVLLVKESLPINLSQFIPRLNVDNVYWRDKFYPKFWLKPIHSSSLFSQKVSISSSF